VREEEEKKMGWEKERISNVVLEPGVLNYFFKTLFLSTDATDFSAILDALSQIELWFKQLVADNETLPLDFDYDFLCVGFDRILIMEHHVITARLLSLIYNFGGVFVSDGRVKLFGERNVVKTRFFYSIFSSSSSSSSSSWKRKSLDWKVWVFAVSLLGRKHEIHFSANADFQIASSVAQATAVAAIFQREQSVRTGSHFADSSRSVGACNSIASGREGHGEKEGIRSPFGSVCSKSDGRVASLAIDVQ
jgi:hypothetical protein